MLVQRCFSVVTLNNIKLRSFQPLVFAEYLFERLNQPVCEHRVPYVKEIPLKSIEKSARNY